MNDVHSVRSVHLTYDTSMEVLVSLAYQPLGATFCVFLKDTKMKKISLSTSYGPKKQPKSISDIARKQRERKQRQVSKQAKLKSQLALSSIEPLEDVTAILGPLKNCSSQEKIDKRRSAWNRIFSNKCKKAIDWRVFPDDKRGVANALFEGTSITSTPVMTDRAVLDQLYETVARELIAYFAANPDHECCFVTTISGDDATAYHKPVIPLFDFKQRVTSTLRAIGPNFIGGLELALFNSHTHPDGGQLIQGHGHFLCFGEGVTAKARAIAVKHGPRYASNATGAKPIVVRTVSIDALNLTRMCAYLFKPPYNCKTWNPPKEGRSGSMQHGKKGDRYLRYLRLAQLRSMMTAEEMTIGGGDGQRIRRAVIKLVRAQCEAAAPLHNRALHPDAIASFWVEVTKELGKTEWHLPVIRTRK